MVQTRRKRAQAKKRQARTDKLAKKLGTQDARVESRQGESPAIAQ
jgi:hypothetical protein